MTANDISGHFIALRELIANTAGEDMPEGEKQKVKALCEAGLRLAESLMLDINRIADSMEILAKK